MQNNNPSSITYYLPIIIAICSVAISWGILMTKVADAQDRITQLEARQETDSEKLTDIQVDVGSIKTSVDFIEAQYKK